MPVMRIGAIAKQLGIGVETIRFYERQGLLQEPERQSSGYRQFDESAVARLNFIIRSKKLGFTLSEIKELLALWFEPATKCCDVRNKAEQKICDIEERVQALQTMKRSLKRLIEQCKKRGTVEECPLLVDLTLPNKRAVRKKV